MSYWIDDRATRTAKRLAEDAAYEAQRAREEAEAVQRQMREAARARRAMAEEEMYARGDLWDAITGLDERLTALEARLTGMATHRGPTEPDPAGENPV